jgi:hypothetical protein
LAVSRRPLALVFALTLGDYLLWNWSLGANESLMALVSGLTLPPLAIVLVWLSAVAAARLAARVSARLRAGARAAHARVGDETRLAPGARATGGKAQAAVASDSPNASADRIAA